MKPFLYILILLISLSAIGQDKTPFGKYVFENTNIGYNEETKTLIVPSNGLPREGCREEYNPLRYTCTEEQGLVTIFIKEHSPGNFETTVFNPAEKWAGKFIAITTIVEDGKVVAQARSIYRNQWNEQEIKEDGHYIVSEFETYYINTEIAHLFDSIKTIEDFDSDETYQGFVTILKSPEYKKQLKYIHEIAFRNVYLHSNRDEIFDRIGDIDAAYFDTYNTKLKYKLSRIKKNEDREKLETKIENIRIRNIENSIIIKDSKNLSEIVGKAKPLMLRFYFEPSGNLTENNLIQPKK